MTFTPFTPGGNFQEIGRTLRRSYHANLLSSGLKITYYAPRERFYGFRYRLRSSYKITYAVYDVKIGMLTLRACLSPQVEAYEHVP